MSENQHGGTELPPASPLSKNSDGANSSTWQSSPLQRLENSARPHLAAPVDVVVVRAGQANSEVQTTRRSVGPSSPGSSFSSSFSAPFRLQPRRPLVPGNVRGSAVHRGRKRSAHSMSFSSGSAFSPSKGLPSFLSPSLDDATTTSIPQTVDVAEAKGESPSHVSTATSKDQESPAPRSNVLVNFHCLSVQSPKARRPLQEDVTSPLPVQFQSSRFLQDKAAVSQPPRYTHSTPPRDHLPRSSFAAYAPTSANTPVASPSTSSPKIAKCTVLNSNGTTPGSVARPPLHGGTSAMMLSLEATSRCAEDIGNERVIPPAVAVCQKNSPDSMSTLHHDDHEQRSSTLNSVFQSPRPRSMFGPVATPKRRRAPNSNNSPIRTPQQDFLSPSSYRSRQARGADFTSPSQRSIRSSPRTPLPRVTLTPRSAGSRSSRGLPRFPSPSDMDLSSPFTGDMGTSYGQYATGGSLAGTSRASTRSRNKAGDSKKGASNNDAFKSPSQASTGSSKMTGYYMGIKTQSLLTPSRSSSILQGIMMQDSSASLDIENASVSDIDEDDAFVLASPSAIEEERSNAASFQPAAKHQKRSSSSMTVKSESCSSLKGMCLIGSSTSLFGLVDQTTAAAVDQESKKPTPVLKGRKSESSLNSLGLTLDECGNGEGGRDLVTPPSMLNSKMLECPPLLHNDTSGVQDNSAQQANRVCVSGADPESVTVTIAKMAHQANHFK